MNIRVCSDCGCEFVPEDNEWICLACEIDRQEEEGEEGLHWDDMYDAMFQHLDSQWSEF